MSSANPATESENRGTAQCTGAHRPEREEERISTATSCVISSAPSAPDELLDIEAVCKFFGGGKALHPATIYRGIGTRYPRPVKVGINSNRWLRSECEAALRDMIAGRIK